MRYYKKIFFYLISILQNNIEKSIEVEKTGADFARFTSKNISFMTHSVKIDNEAEIYITKFFPKLVKVNYEDVIVCIGEMIISNAAAFFTSELQNLEEPSEGKMRINKSLKYF